MIDYESPVKVFQDEIQMQIENEIMKAVCGVGVAVDKEELLKALKYDREQYEKGFSDCETTYKKKIEDVLERLEKKIKPLHNPNWNAAIEESIQIIKGELL